MKKEPLQNVFPLMKPDSLNEWNPKPDGPLFGAITAAQSFVASIVDARAAKKRYQVSQTKGIKDLATVLQDFNAAQKKGIDHFVFFQMTEKPPRDFNGIFKECPGLVQPLLQCAKDTAQDASFQNRRLALITLAAILGNTNKSQQPALAEEIRPFIDEALKDSNPAVQLTARDVNRFLPDPNPILSVPAVTSLADAPAPR